MYRRLLAASFISEAGVEERMKLSHEFLGGQRSNVLLLSRETICVRLAGRREPAPKQCAWASTGGKRR